MEKQSQKIKDVVSGLVELLEEKGEKKLLPDVTAALEELQGQKKVTQAMVETAIDLSKQELSIIKEFIKKKLGVEVPLKVKVDKDLLGGFILHAGDYVLDASLRKELTKLNNLLTS
ncbi:MAG: ATP synthase subunit delta [Candidatus Gottesmanbacteria bacterium GW2011_GWC2_39_8]|uniref:ATP synthase subunit delta n=1 Tax=Candidatus Gottesmanbacteria bacterium GW2011_GWC2_39_8 TaxID=1618450 RepID=A0A0G0Q1I8_9BACT|nr:MAG: ATP synthase subunit delta [Candidatus Gottesmanbacteria bacterium GW2011_GWC2_39_8]